MSPETESNTQIKKIASWAFFVVLIGAAVGLMIWSFSGGRGDLAKSADSVDPQVAGIPLKRAAAKNMRNPYPEDEALLALGKKRYEKFCIRCHGSNGRGVVEHEFSNRMGKRTEGEYIWVLTYGIEGTPMLGQAARLKLKDRWATVRYVRSVLGGEDPKNPGVSTIAPTSADAEADNDADKDSDEDTDDAAGGTMPAGVTTDDDSGLEAK